jgi:hypothetical protein
MRMTAGRSAPPSRARKEPNVQRDTSRSAAKAWTTGHRPPSRHRVAEAEDDELRAILVHNRDEEKEHAAMVLEWLRRQDPALDRNLRKYLFTEEPLSALIAEEKAEPPAPVAPAGHLDIGDLRPRAANED